MRTSTTSLPQLDESSISSTPLALDVVPFAGGEWMQPINLFVQPSVNIWKKWSTTRRHKHFYHKFIFIFRFAIISGIRILSVNDKWLKMSCRLVSQGRKYGAQSHAQPYLHNSFHSKVYCKFIRIVYWGYRIWREVFRMSNGIFFLVVRAFRMKWVRS